MAKETSYGKLIRCPRVNVLDVYKAITDLFSLDVVYTEHPASDMELTEIKQKECPHHWLGWIIRQYCGNSIPNSRSAWLNASTSMKKKKFYVIIKTDEER